MSIDYLTSDLNNIGTVNVNKLTSNFIDKEKFVLHYENLQFCLRLGLKLRKI